MEIRTETVEPLIAEGKKYFSGERPGPHGEVPRYQVLGWLFDICQAKGAQVNLVEREHIVHQIHLAANGVMDTVEKYLTVGELRDLLRNLPENMPVFYERVTDEFLAKCNGASHLFVSESRAAKVFDLAAVATGEDRLFRVVPGPDGDVAQQLLEAFGVFTAFVKRDVDGRKALILTTFY